MSSTVRLAAVLAAASAAAAMGAWVLARMWTRRPRDSREIERLRRLDLSRRGRITGGTIVDVVEQEDVACKTRAVVYRYEVAGVVYETSQDVSWMEDAGSRTKLLLGQPANVKYDTRKPVNSIIVGEEWSGLPKPFSQPGEVPSITAAGDPPPK